MTKLQFANFQSKRDNLQSSYLNKPIPLVALVMDHTLLIMGHANECP